VPGKNVTHDVVDAICRMLRTGRYQLGTRLPGEHELATELRVGRSAVREAVRELITLNVLEIRPGAGTFVRSLRSDLLFRTDSLGHALDEQVRAELLELRRIVEPEASALAAQRASAEDLVQLERDVVLLRNGVLRGADHVPADLDFHLSLLRATHNASLARKAVRSSPFTNTTVRHQLSVTQRSIGSSMRLCAMLTPNEPGN